MTSCKLPTQNLTNRQSAHARRLLNTLVVSIALVGPANACEIEPSRGNIFIKLFFPNVSNFTLFSDPAQSPRIQVTEGTKPNSVHIPEIRQVKRLRIVRGEKLRVEELRIRSGAASSLNFKEDDDAFAGSLRFAEGSEHLASGWGLKVSSLNGKTVWAVLTYETPRSLSEAFDDAICTYQALPQMMAQNE